MKMEELKKRKTPRHHSFDYNSAGVYFITICTQDRRCILSRIVVGTGVPDCPSKDVIACPQLELSTYGKIADKYIKQLNEFYHHLSVEHYVIMPNHIHLIIKIAETDGTSGRPSPTGVNAKIPAFIGTFKRFTNKARDCDLWQRSYYDHIIRDETDFIQKINYIQSNPFRWADDEYYL